jgi:hypothetical protein
LSGPSADSAVAGRIAAVITTGLVVATVMLRKQAVSSSVSVPWVMTMPSTAGSSISRCTRRDSTSQCCGVMSLLSTLKICVASMRASSASCGTAASRASGPSWPAV